MSTQPTADQPLVTHEDLAMLRGIKSRLIPEMDYERDLLDRLIEAAEADKPALPEGWVLIGGMPRWHDGKGGIAFKPGGSFVGRVVDYSDPVTPLVTAASLAPEGWHVDGKRMLNGRGVEVLHWDDASEAFDLLEHIIAAAQAERGESR